MKNYSKDGENLLLVVIFIITIIIIIWIFWELIEGDRTTSKTGEKCSSDNDCAGGNYCGGNFACVQGRNGGTQGTICTTNDNCEFGFKCLTIPVNPTPFTNGQTFSFCSR
uniref:Transmembrane protein n=1 Tax=Pithovirus LCPAC104 TaxID=2506589 RepID=A0A481Z3Q9_9VIRU|nr:MAG: transmembrane protein [Pithovirus LCPAC104]